MAGVNMPAKKGSSSSNLLSLAGAGVGAFFGGPAGAAAGMQVGGMVGGMADANKSQGPQAVDAISRRKMQLDNTPQRQIRESIDSLKYIPDDATRAELAKPLMQADYLARNKA